MALKTLDLSGQTKSPKKLKVTEDDNEDGTKDIEFAEVEDKEQEDDESVDSWEELLDDDDPDKESDTEDTEEEDSEEEPEGSDEEDPDKDEDEEEDYEPRGPRENHRIRSLVSEKNEAITRANNAEKAREDMERSLIEYQKKTVESNVNMLEGNITVIKDRMKKAHEESDHNALVELQDQLEETREQLRVQKEWKAPEPKKAEVKRVEKEQTDPDEAFAAAPKILKRWAAKNSWFRNPVTAKDFERQQEAIQYANTLAGKGYDLEDPELYSLVDKRLEKLGLAKPTKKPVKSKTDTDDSSTRRKKKISQTVQGASRTSPNSKSKNSNKVTLTQEQMQIADLYGLTHAEYAMEVLKIENADKAGRRMTSLFPDKKK